jgi:dTDP-glucose pyrophosphorylase
MVLQVVIPMAGIGSRFKNYGFKTNKYLLPINLELQPMIELAIISLNISVPCEYFFIINEQDGYDENLRNVLRSISEKYHFNYRIVSVYKLTEGPACTVARAINVLNMEQPMIVSNSDQILDWDFNKFLKNCEKYDGCVLTYKPNYPLKMGLNDKHSFARVNEITNTVEECREKVVISDKALVGVHYFKETKTFFDAYDYMKQNNIRDPNGEFYLSLIYQSMIEKHYTVGISDLNLSTEYFYPTGEPDDYFHYLYTIGDYEHITYNLNKNELIHKLNEHYSIKYCEEVSNKVIQNNGLILLLKGEGCTDYGLQSIKPFQITNDNIITQSLVEFIHIQLSELNNDMIEKKIWNIHDFTRGWFIGDFLPSIIKTKNYEIALLTHLKDEQWDYHYHEKSDEINFLINGKMRINDRIITERQVFYIPKKQIACPQFLENCKILCIKFPSVIGDKYCL